MLQDELSWVVGTVGLRRAGSISEVRGKTSRLLGMRRLAGIMPVGREGSAVWRSGLCGKVTCVAVGQGCQLQ